MVILGVQALELFLTSIRSPETRSMYSIYFKKYQNFMGYSDLFCGGNPRQIEEKIIEFIMDMRNQGKGYGAIHNYASAVLAFYKINDVALNVTKINRFIPVQKRVRKDRAWTHEEIGKILQFADERMKVIILLMASSGIRVGSLNLLKLRNIDGQKLTVYENEREEYFTFVTYECQKAIDSYIDYRTRYGEKIDENSYLIREQFNKRDPFRAGHPKPVNKFVIKWAINDLEKKSGVWTYEVSAAHGFRKFFTTELIKSKVNPEIREMLLGHKIGLASAYYRPTEDEMFQEYMKAVNNLTINEENRLKMKIKNIENQKDELSTKITESILKKLEAKGIKL